MIREGKKGNNIPSIHWYLTSNSKVQIIPITHRIVLVHHRISTTDQIEN